jgi:hypothetical protein
MSEEIKNLMHRTLTLEMHRKILRRAAELVSMGWTTEAGARNERGDRVQGTSPVAFSWCLTGAISRALFEVVGIDVYRARNGSIVDAVNFWWALMNPVHQALAERGLDCHIVEWNDHSCGGADEAEALLREAAARVSEPGP